MKVKMKVPENGTGCSFEGQEYTADKDGIVEVPEEAVAVLLSHGLTIPPVAPQQQGKKGS